VRIEEHGPAGSAGDNRVPGMVERVVFLGAATQVLLRLAPGIPLQALMQNDGERPDLVQGTALARAEPAGRIVYIGIAGVPSPVDSRDLVLGDLTVVGILGASAGLAPAVEYYADGRVDPARIVEVTVGLEQAAEALAGKIGTGTGTKIHIDPCG
jgi:threonine dehydrogenase-like Zn-dependent dehydrogenase